MLMSLPARYWLNRRTMPGWSLPKAVITKRSHCPPGAKPSNGSTGRAITWYWLPNDSDQRTRSASSSGAIASGRLTIMMRVK